MRLKVNTSKEAIAESSGSSFINKSGIYDITIDFASVAVSSGGAESINFNIDYNGNKQTLWGPYVTDKNGDDIEIGNNLISKLGVIVGMGDDDEFDFEDQEHPVGKDNELKEFTVIENFSDKPVKVHVQEEYSRYNGEIRDRLVIKAFFREDGASAEEIINETEVGKRLALVEEKYASNVTYRDDVTAEEVEEWKAARAAERSGGSSTPSKGRVSASATKKKVFGKK